MAFSKKDIPTETVTAPEREPDPWWTRDPGRMAWFGVLGVTATATAIAAGFYVKSVVGSIPGANPPGDEPPVQAQTTTPPEPKPVAVDTEAARKRYIDNGMTAKECVEKGERNFDVYAGDRVALMDIIPSVSEWRLDAYTHQRGYTLYAQDFTEGGKREADFIDQTYSGQLVIIYNRSNGLCQANFVAMDGTSWKRTFQPRFGETPTTRTASASSPGDDRFQIGREKLYYVAEGQQDNISSIDDVGPLHQGDYSTRRDVEKWGMDLAEKSGRGFIELGASSANPAPPASHCKPGSPFYYPADCPPKPVENGLRSSIDDLPVPTVAEYPSPVVERLPEIELHETERTTILVNGEPVEFPSLQEIEEAQAGESIE